MVLIGIGFAILIFGSTYCKAVKCNFSVFIDVCVWIWNNRCTLAFRLFFSVDVLVRFSYLNFCSVGWFLLLSIISIVIYCLNWRTCSCEHRWYSFLLNNFVGEFLRLIQTPLMTTLIINQDWKLFVFSKLLWRASGSTLSQVFQIDWDSGRKNVPKTEEVAFLWDIDTMYKTITYGKNSHRKTSDYARSLISQRCFSCKCIGEVLFTCWFTFCKKYNFVRKTNGFWQFIQEREQTSIRL